MKSLLRLLAIFVALIALIALITYWQVSESHREAPFIGESASELNPSSALLHRLILFGDAGKSTEHPYEGSLALAVRRAQLLPQHSSVIALGDNIYRDGYPVLAAGQLQFDAAQLEDISHLNAQLQVASRSGAEMFVLPGNHDWDAGQLDGQARHILDFSENNNANTSLIPYHHGHRPQVIERPGLSIIFVDSMWMIKADTATFDAAIAQLQKLLADSRRQQPDNVIVIAAHHPIESMGPHYTGLGSLGATLKWLLKNLALRHFDSDLTDSPYRRYIDAIERSSEPYSKVLFTGGHDHSLQLFKSARSPHYRLVSGAANSSKLSRVWHNNNSLFAQSIEGLMELEIYQEGVLLTIYTVNALGPAYKHWLWRNPDKTNDATTGPWPAQ